MGQRLTGMTAGQSQFPVAPSGFDFKQHGQSGHWMSNALPHLSKMADDMCIIKTMHTEAINHDPAITYFQTGFQLSGRPSMGSWLSYGLGTSNENLPNFVVMVSHRGGQPLYDRLWGSGFLPSVHQGVKFRSKGDPVLYLSDPKGFPKEARRRVLDDIAALNLESFDKTQQPEILTRIAQYEMAFRMQSSIPELTDLSGESDPLSNMYGEEAKETRHICAQLPDGTSTHRTRGPVCSIVSPRMGSSLKPAKQFKSPVQTNRPGLGCFAD
jgi:hypothetical protein